MAIQEVVDWAGVTDDNVAHHPTGPQGEKAVRISTSFREMQAAIARWRDTLGGGGTPGGSDTQIQYNNAGAFGGMAEWTYNNVSGDVTVTGADISVDSRFLTNAAGIEVEDTIVVNADAGQGDHAIKFFNSLGLSSRKRWRINANPGFNRLEIQASDDADSSHQAGILLTRSSTNQITSCFMGANAFTFTNGGGTATDINMSSHDLIVGTEIKRAAGTGNLALIGGDQAGLGAKINLYGQTGSQASDMYFESGSGNRWMQWDESAGQLRIRTSSGGKVTALDINNDQTANFFGTIIAPAATTALEPLRIPHGTAPTTPTDGALWSTTAGFFGRVNGTTVGPFAAGGGGIGGSITNDQIAVGAATANDIEGSSALTFTATQFTAGNYVFNRDQTVGAAQDGQVLTYNNSSGEIELQAAAAGSREFISETSITAVASFNMTWDETVYNKIEFEIVDMRVGTDAVHLEVRLGHTDGGTIISSANYSAVFNSGLSTWTSSTGQTEIRLTGAGAVGNLAGEFVQGEITVKNFRSANGTASVEARVNYDNTAGNVLDNQVFGRLLASQSAYDTIQFRLSSGNFVASGTVRMYGYRI